MSEDFTLISMDVACGLDEQTARYRKPRLRCRRTSLPMSMDITCDVVEPHARCRGPHARRPTTWRVRTRLSRRALPALSVILSRADGEGPVTRETRRLNLRVLRRLLARMTRIPNG